MLGDAGSNTLGRAARFGVREALTGRGDRRDRRARRPHPPRRAPSLGDADRADARPAGARPPRDGALSDAPTKYVFVTGGVVSALGKGIVAASLGRLLKARGLRVQAQKFDPYLNVDPGTMSPFQHGEVFVTEDGAETDLDIGHYERFIDENLSRNASHTAGAIWDTVLRKERKGEFLGATVQVIPHITNEIKSRIRRAAEATDPPTSSSREIGGTVGDIESLPFLEAIRQFRREVGPGERALPARHARPVHRGGRRAEDEADAALGERAAPHRYPPGHRRLPLAASRSPTTSARRSRSSPTSTREAVIALAGRPGRLPRPERAAGGRASTGSSARSSGCRTPPRRPRRVARADRAHRRAAARRSRSRSSASTSSSTTPTSRCTRR